MLTYIQIGKTPRMAINDTVANIRTDFIKQIPKLGWKPAPIYFYTTAKGKECKGILIPYKWKFKHMKEYEYSFYWITENEYWDIDATDKSKVRFGTVGWDKMMETINKYREMGYEIY